jgi:hypothetical protein
MFPLLCQEMKDLVPRVYFGGEDVPPYYHLKMDSTGSMEDPDGCGAYSSRRFGRPQSGRRGCACGYFQLLSEKDDFDLRLNS